MSLQLEDSRLNPQTRSPAERRCPRWVRHRMSTTPTSCMGATHTSHSMCCGKNVYIQNKCCLGYTFQNSCNLEVYNKLLFNGCIIEGGLLTQVQTHVMERLWGPLTWLYYRGWPANNNTVRSVPVNNLYRPYRYEKLRQSCSPEAQYGGRRTHATAYSHTEGRMESASTPC